MPKEITLKEQECIKNKDKNTAKVEVKIRC